MALELLQTLLNVSERAAAIARLIRGEKVLFDSLIEEKDNDFIHHDYKTFADVLIQATVQYYVSKQFPQMYDHIKGEESCSFINGCGDSIYIILTDNIINTTKLINKAIGEQQPLLAERLTEVIYSNDINVVISNEHKDRLKSVAVDINQLGIWIDPIDGTNEYVKGHCSDPINDIHDNGLPVTIIIIGVYDRTNGLPLMGVLNQPFYHKDMRDNWRGRVIWGVATNDCKVACIPNKIVRDPLLKERLCLTSHVDDHIISTADWSVRRVSGCGYKFLCIIEGCADLFIVTKSSCYKWDTCGPQAILMALGGGIIKWEDMVKEKKDVPVVYHKPDNLSFDGPMRWNNVGGVIGYIDLEQVYSFLNKNS